MVHRRQDSGAARDGGGRSWARQRRVLSQSLSRREGPRWTLRERRSHRRLGERRVELDSLLWWVREVREEPKRGGGEALEGRLGVTSGREASLLGGPKRSRRCRNRCARGSGSCCVAFVGVVERHAGHLQFARLPFGVPICRLKTLSTGRGRRPPRQTSGAGDMSRRLLPAREKGLSEGACSSGKPSLTISQSAGQMLLGCPLQRPTNDEQCEVPEPVRELELGATVDAAEEGT